MALDIHLITTGDVAVLHCRGRLLFGSGADALRDRASRALDSRRVLALDLEAVHQIDAHGVGVLAELCALAQRAGEAVIVTGASKRVRLMLRLTHLDTVLFGWSDPALAPPCQPVALAGV